MTITPSPQPPPKMVPYADLAREIQARISAQQQYNRERERRVQVEQQLELERKLWRTKFKPAEKLIIPELQRQIDRPVVQDSEGFSRFCYATAAINIGMSGKAPKRAIEKIIQQCPNLPIETKIIKEYDQEEGRNIPRLYIRATQNLIQAATTTEISHPIKQGGNQYQCQNPDCLSHNVKIERRLVCLECGHTSQLDPTFPNGKLDNSGNNSRTNLVLENDDKKNIESDANLSLFLKPVTPPSDDKLSTDLDEKNVQEIESPVDLRAAAELLLSLAGDANEHIEMSRAGEKKYYTVARRLTLDDTLDHLRGGQARGGQCSRSDGKTRGLGWDADDPETWEQLQAAARRLAAVGYFPILEWSPADRGGHLWVIYSDLIDLASARRHVCEIAPLLESIKEYWPGPADAKKWNRVRLPGGKYVRYGKHVEYPVNAWCELVSVVDGENSRNGQAAAALLLSHQSPIELVPVLDECEIVLADPEREIWEVPDASEFALAGEEASQPRAEHEIGNLANVAPPAGDDQGQTALEKRTLPVVDPTWVAKYGDVATTKLWFAISEERSATWFNENHSLEEIRPRERNGMALSPNGSERSASTAYHNTPDGERYTDFSTHGRRANGQHDTGDVLELAVKVWERSKASLLTETAKEMNDQARAEMESAARSGTLPPMWVQELMTPSGWSRYDWVLASSPAGESPATIPVRAAVGKIVPVERKNDAIPTTTGGVTGFHSDSQLTMPVVTDSVAAGLQNSALAVPHSKEERIEQLAQELDALIGDPCIRCGCTIQRDLCGAWVCIKCYPSKGLGDDVWERLRILFPVRRSL